MKNIIEQTAYAIISDVTLITSSNDSRSTLSDVQFYRLHDAVINTLRDTVRVALHTFIENHRDDFYAGPQPIPFGLLSDFIENLINDDGPTAPTETAPTGKTAPVVFAQSDGPAKLLYDFTVYRNGQPTNDDETDALINLIGDFLTRPHDDGPHEHSHSHGADYPEHSHEHDDGHHA